MNQKCYEIIINQKKKVSIYKTFKKILKRFEEDEKNTFFRTEIAQILNKLVSLVFFLTR